MTDGRARTSLPHFLLCILLSPLRDTGWKTERIELPFRYNNFRPNFEAIKKRRLIKRYVKFKKRSWESLIGMIAERIKRIAILRIPDAKNRKDTTIFKFSLKSTIRFIDFYSTNFKILFSKIIFFIYFLTWTNFLLDPKMKIIFILHSNSPRVPRNVLYRSFKIPIPSYSRYNDHLSSFPSSNVVHNNDSRRQVFFEFSLSKPVPIF